MSRALDKDVVASLQTGDPLAAYKAISEVLTWSKSNDGLDEIEILRRNERFQDGTYVLRDGLAVGVIKVGLVQAFLVARKMLAAHLDGTTPRASDELFATTGVILLMDPEYLTAANTRKRLIQSQLYDKDVLVREKHFVDSLLTSRLHRHTKSPTLWSHRRWLLQKFALQDIPLDVLADLTSVVFVAGERHPRNYYAWCHARLLAGLRSGDSGQGILAAVKNWCFQHHTDISGWSFLSFLLNIGASPDKSACSLTLAEVLSLAESLRLTNESVWVFLRTLVASGLVGDEDYRRFLHASQDLMDSSSHEIDKRVLNSARDWSNTYRVKAKE
ncbi:hypothetical protein B0H66DRAFT_341829 [Apodospora peruviana]|uniref:Protein prenyltransferase n=1 Tax=Apodospora peruviana TaxID=516989 RepID=A0AAE0M168_9PEZI|nr:hypothetical protein B0H66DRAFT_341829 [Apodospora peruviana]